MLNGLFVFVFIKSTMSSSLSHHCLFLLYHIMYPYPMIEYLAKLIQYVW